MGKNKDKGIGYAVLKVVGLGVLVTVVSMLAPIFPYVLLKLYLRKKFNHSYRSGQIRNAVAHLKRKKFIAYKNNRFILTKLGKKYLRKKVLDNLKINKTVWDHKWRVVTFDIPQDKTAERHILRSRLKRLGFYHFQRSVFIIPYPCEKEIDQLVDDLDVSEYVYVLVSERFRNDKLLIKKFKVK